MLQVLPLNRRKPADRNRFIRLPYGLYRNDPNWVAPLIMDQHILLSDKEPFYEHAETQVFVAVRDGRDVGRIAATENKTHNEVHQDRVGFAGFFECENDPEAAQGLFAAAGAWLKGRGLNVMRGPINLSTNHTVGLLVAGEPGPPMMDMTYNPAYYERLFEGAGFKKSMDVLAHVMDVATPETLERLEKLSQRAMSRGNVTERPIDMKHFDREMAVVKEIYNAAWEKNWGFVPLTEKEFDHIAANLKLVVDVGLVRFVYVDGRPAGFMAALGNINEILIKLKGHLFPFGIFRVLFGKSRLRSVRLMLMGVVKEFRGRGLEAVMYHHSLQYALKRGYTKCENSWLLESNEQVLRASEFMGGREYRRYRIYDLPL
jgi:GNAT superfamily N-acetyltransferase